MVHNFLYGSLSWGILWMALLLGSCKDSVEEPGFDDAYARVPQSVVMQLNVALSAPTRDVPDCEKVKELRVILLDEKTKNVEFNELMDVENYSVPEDSRFLYEYKKEGIMTTVGKKILYALANSEELIQDIVTLPGAEMITGLEIPTLQEYGIDREAFYSQIEKMAQDAMDSGSPQNTMRQPDRQAVMDIYKKIYEGE